MRFKPTLWAFSLLIAVNSASSTLQAEQLSSAPAGSFSIVVIPDTQSYRGEGVKGGKPDNHDPVTNPIFEAHTKWIAANLDRQSIAFVSHVGDIVDINEPRQWKVAQECMDGIHGKVPYGISVGNHDMTSEGDSSLFQEFFPKSRFQDCSWYGGCFEPADANSKISANNANSYQLFSAGGRDFLFMHLECNAPEDVVEWANGVLAANRDRMAFVTSHMGWGPELHPQEDAGYITDPKGRMKWIKIHGKRGNSPQQLWEKCYSKHPNLLAVFSGDQSRTQALSASTPGEQGNLVHEILQDYGSGWLRLIRIFPEEGRMDIITFDPRTGELCEGTKLVPDVRQHQFSVPCEALKTTP
ncbi:metallophosphoesterase [Planctomicrobium sp. SH661]|uniref:metallophosphoesterase n=1 Tax=Planctomicrobium sp. SH661 TaxID=3448124 RepID=UPI003F5AE027